MGDHQRFEQEFIELNAGFFSQPRLSTGGYGAMLLISRSHMTFPMNNGNQIGVKTPTSNTHLPFPQPSLPFIQVTRESSGGDLSDNTWKMRLPFHCQVGRSKVHLLDPFVVSSLISGQSCPPNIKDPSETLFEFWMYS